MTKNRYIAMDQVDLRFLSLRSPRAVCISNMARSMKKQAQLTPVVVTGEEQPYILIDGFKRYFAAQSLGLKSLKANFIHVDLTQAKIMMYLMNRKEGLSYLQEAMLVRELVEEDGLKQTEVARMMDHHKSWVNRRLMTIQRLRPEILEDLRLDLIPAGSAGALSRVALCNQGDFSAAIQNHSLTLKEIRILTDVFCKTRQPEKRRFLLDSPKQALALLAREQNSLSTLKNIHKRLLEFKQVLSSGKLNLNDQFSVCVNQIKSELCMIEKALAGEEK